MCKGNVNSDMFQHYLNAMVRAGMVEMLPSGLYLTTKKGQAFLRDHKELSGTLDSKHDELSLIREVWNTTLVI